MTTESTSSSSIPGSRLFLVLAACLAVRLLFSVFFGWESVHVGSDAVSYDAYATAILNQSDWLTNPTFFGDYRPPVYPLFIASIYKVFGVGNVLAVLCAQALVGTLTVYYLFRLSAAIFGEKRSTLALLWAGVYVFYVWYGGMLLRETLVYFFVIALFYHLWRLLHLREGANTLTSPHLWAFLVSLVLVVHTDARFLFYIPWLVFLFIGFLGVKAGIKRYALTLALLLLLMAPWQVRNFVAYDGMVLVNTRTLDLRPSSSNIRFSLLSMKPITEVHENPHWRANSNYPSEEERAAIKQGINVEHRPDYEVRMILDDVRPATTFMGRKLFYTRDMWVPFRFSYDYSPFPGARIVKPWSAQHNAAVILFYGFLLPFAGVSVVQLCRRRQKAVWFLLFPILVHAVLHFVTFGLGRYRAQIDAFIIILGCAGVVEVGGMLLRRNRSRMASGDLVDAPAGGGE